MHALAYFGSDNACSCQSSIFILLEKIGLSEKSFLTVNKKNYVFLRRVMATKESHCMTSVLS